MSSSLFRGKDEMRWFMRIELDYTVDCVQNKVALGKSFGCRAYGICRYFYVVVYANDFILLGYAFGFAVSKRVISSCSTSVFRHKLLIIHMPLVELM